MLTIEQALNKVPSYIKATYLDAKNKCYRHQTVTERECRDFVFSIKNANFERNFGENEFAANHIDLCLLLQPKDTGLLSIYGEYWWKSTPKFYILHVCNIYEEEYEIARLRKDNQAISYLIEKLDRRKENQK